MVVKPNGHPRRGKPLPFLFIFSLFEQDAAAGRKGLEQCARLMADYDRCMAKVPARKLIRVRFSLCICVCVCGYVLRYTSPPGEVVVNLLNSHHSPPLSYELTALLRSRKSID